MNGNREDLSFASGNEQKNIMATHGRWSFIAAALLALAEPQARAGDDLLRVWQTRSHDRSDYSDFDRWERIIRAQEEESPFDEPIATDRPDFTEASSVVGRGVLQIESGYTFSYDDESGTRTRSHSVPESLFRYGVSKNVELRLVWNYIWSDTTTAGTTERINGADDLILGTKIALTTQMNLIPETAIILAMTTPTGGTDITNRHAEFALNYLWGFDLPNDKTLAGSFGYRTSTEFNTVTLPLLGPQVVADRHNVFHTSVTHGIPLWESWNAYFEYFGLYFEGLAGGRPQNYFDSGVTYLVNNNLQLDVRMGVGLNPSADDLFAGTGVSVRY